MRMLSSNEIGFVSGGSEPLETVDVIASRIRGPRGSSQQWAPLSAMSLENLMAREDSKWGKVALIAVLLSEAKDFLEDYIKETTGYENAQEWLKDQLDEMGRYLVDNTCGIMSNGKTVAPKPCGVPASD